MLPFLLYTQTLPATTLHDSGSHWISEGGECLDHLTGHGFNMPFPFSFAGLQGYTPYTFELTGRNHYKQCLKQIEYYSGMF